MGNPFCHIDLTTGDPAAAKKFYKRLFDWKLTDYPEMHWTGIDVGEGVGGGMGGKQSPEQPTAWTPYVAVSDVKKTIAKAKKAGATIVMEYMPISNMGALGIFIDPQGATIGVWETAKGAAKSSKKKAKKKASKKGGSTNKKKSASPKAKAAPAKKASKKKASKKKAKKKARRK